MKLDTGTASKNRPMPPAACRLPPAACRLPPAAAVLLDLYAEVEALPENLVAEIIDGELFTQPRPAAPHALADSGLGADLHVAFGRERGGPDG